MILEKLNDSANVDESRALLDDRNENLTEAEILQILADLEALFDASLRLMHKVSSQSLGNDGMFYRMKDRELECSASGPTFTSANLQISFIFSFLSVAVCVPLLMLRNLISQRYQNEESTPYQ